MRIVTSLSRSLPLPPLWAGLFRCLHSSSVSGELMSSSPPDVSVLLIIATNFPATFLARFLSFISVCREVCVGDGVDVLGVGVGLEPKHCVCFPVAPLFLGLVAFPSVGGSSALVIVGFVYPKAARARVSTYIPLWGGGVPTPHLVLWSHFVGPPRGEPINLI